MTKAPQPRRRSRTHAPKPFGAASVLLVSPNASAPAPDTAASPSGAARRFPISAVEASFLWLAVVLCWIFAGPRGWGPAPLPVAYAVVGATLASLIVIGRRWPFAGYLMLCFAAGLIGMGRPWRGGRW
jgi:hypothetical protein